MRVCDISPVDHTGVVWYTSDMSQKTYQGDIGVAAASLYYCVEGWIVMLPSTEHSKYDMVIEKGGNLKRVQAKTTNYMPNGKYVVQLRTSGGNQSTKATITKLNIKDADIVFVLCGDGSFYELPISKVAGRSELTITSKGYDEYRKGELGLEGIFTRH